MKVRYTMKDNLLPSKINQITNDGISASAVETAVNAILDELVDYGVSAREAIFALKCATRFMKAALKNKSQELEHLSAREIMD